MGFEDAYTLSPRDYSQLIKDIQLVSSRGFIIIDADNGGQSYKNARYAYNHYSTLGASIAFMENKAGVKFNSLAESSAHTLEDRESFASKVEAAKKVQNRTLVGIRLEDAIVADNNPEQALSDAMETTKYFMKHAKPDFFLFHWKKETGEVPVEFAKRYFEVFKKENNLPYLACVPTTYSKNITNTQLGEAGYRLIILGNPVLRAQIKAVQDVAKSIVEADSLKSADQNVLTLKDLMKINSSL
jgi:2-methylisocitrate lyase-like PEP mutase family enzyme